MPQHKYRLNIFHDVILLNAPDDIYTTDNNCPDVENHIIDVYDISSRVLDTPLLSVTHTRHELTDNPFHHHLINLYFHYQAMSFQFRLMKDMNRDTQWTCSFVTIYNGITS